MWINISCVSNAIYAGTTRNMNGTRGILKLVSLSIATIHSISEMCVRTTIKLVDFSRVDSRLFEPGLFEVSVYPIFLYREFFLTNHSNIRSLLSNSNLQFYLKFVYSKSNSYTKKLQFCESSDATDCLQTKKINRNTCNFIYSTRKGAQRHIWCAGEGLA